MGNCQAAEAATVVIQHPGNQKIERIYWSVSAHEIMNSNPGHYVALLITSSTMKSENGTPIKQLKLLRPDDTLLIGHVYRLITFEDVLKEFAAKKCVKLGKLLKEGGALSVGMKIKGSDSGSNPNANSKSQNYMKPEQDAEHRLENSNAGSSGGGRGQRGMGRHYGGGSQWRPALQSIAEIGIN
ncbi:uncharacterized protein LOC101222947 [Cucumis sativus]|uniref:DUF4228 domain-containing protein n=1 Tax=Cucumis sativus TaxID=3659 RepID=A0A0A0KLJ3_CUCSA|nr:uncharacterized protein LOC101222947 [Cucumis sativus]KGN48621.1 hypothetical protein Csa_004276 [Cucumis sativus]